MYNKENRIAHIGAGKLIFHPEIKDIMGILKVNYIEINGKKYTERPQPENKRRMSKIELLAMALGNFDLHGLDSRYTRPFPELKNSLVDEFRLIEQKKSRLTSAERGMVRSRFHQIYMEVQDAK